MGTGTPWAARTRLPACSRRSTAPHTRRVADTDPPDPADDGGAAHRRTVLFTAVGAVLVAALLFAVVARVVSTNPATGGSTDREGNRVARFEVGRATDFARTIARTGPILFPDPQGKSRDIYVQHLGDTNWLAFEARATGASRQCVLTWDGQARVFIDPCDGRTFPEDGTGLVGLPTRVNEKGRVVVDLSRNAP